MKKTNIITITALAANFLGSIVFAGDFSAYKAGTNGIAIPAYNQLTVSRAFQCEIDLSASRGEVANLQGQLSESQNAIINLKNEVESYDRRLQLVPGTNEYACSHGSGLVGQEYKACLDNRRALDEIGSSSSEIRGNLGHY